MTDITARLSNTSSETDSILIYKNWDKSVNAMLEFYATNIDYKHSITCLISSHIFDYKCLW